MNRAPLPSDPPEAAPPIRVMVVDDSVMVRGLVVRWLTDAGSDLQVVASHANGRLATDDVQKTQPDVVVLDLEMPGMDGLTALPLFLERRPGVAVLVASALTRRGAEVSLKALTLGAADYLPKPDASQGPAAAEAFKRELVTKVRSLGARRRNRGSMPRPPIGQVAPAPVAERAVAAQPAPAIRKVRPDEKLRPYSMTPPTILAIGSSTGGPQALTRVFTDIGPAIGNVPVVIVQHMPATFTAILAEHMARASGRPAREGTDGEPLLPGHIYVAPGGFHMLVARSGKEVVLRINDGPPENFCKPAVDPLFRSVSEVFGAGTLAAVLTGMGSDGAIGARLISAAGGSVIAQDEESSVVWGMPGAVVAAGACADILPIGDIGRKITRILTGGRA
ncbi:protein-glutamate methylesterase/protein-glutamine glutaminase [Aquabacter spiritensis]|uniref:Protein-glutamate methylesterase/protein-glutamine glutaminase n=1 Tax=Aquabacter spiritensis TaxID=933073 RepID=A0A4R3M4K2_9HYPH|nr:chemotaxis response regulator protein-glutamate methylesterase [Aquabacter spiritensis]TCT07962.1 two-component system chemotaxis response regulator CheB [Aquabacter spiritensis]